MSWNQTGVEPLPEPVLTKVYKAIWHHLAAMNQPENNNAIFSFIINEI